MYYHNGYFYERGKQLKIVSQTETFVSFDNGKKFLTFEIQNKIKNYNETESIRIKNKIEHERYTK